MSATAITFEHPAAEGRAYAAHAMLDCGVFVHVTGIAELDAVELSRSDVGTGTRQSFRITAAQARALGAELLAAAAAVDAARGVAVQPVEG